jgi:hypothetical protein
VVHGIVVSGHLLFLLDHSAVLNVEAEQPKLLVNSSFERDHGLL